MLMIREFVERKVDPNSKEFVKFVPVFQSEQQRMDAKEARSGRDIAQ